MYLGSGIPSSVSPSAATLALVSPGNWGGTLSAPSTPGEYHFTVGIFDHAGKRNVIDNDGWNVTVAGSGPSGQPGSPTSGLQPVPADIPLAPTFTWGNPVAATFTAEGKTINGSEVSTNSRPDVPASAVSDFYSTRLPRSGWAIDQSPPAGATTFSITATSGNQVCVVQYGSGAVQIYYGNL
jgi:hypothetical protein